MPYELYSLFPSGLNIGKNMSCFGRHVETVQFMFSLHDRFLLHF